MSFNLALTSETPSVVNKLAPSFIVIQQLLFDWPFMLQKPTSTVIELSTNSDFIAVRYVVAGLPFFSRKFIEEMDLLHLVPRDEESSFWRKAGQNIEDFNALNQ